VLGWAFTLPLVMLAWVPFRAGSLSESLALLGRVCDPTAYGSINLRENFYLLTAAILLGMLLLRGSAAIVEKWSRGGRFRQLGDIALMSAALFAVFIFLRPISQFIYFQF
jgi:hypothetical protein